MSDSAFRQFEEQVRNLRKDIEGSHIGLINITSPLLQHLRLLNVVKQHHGGMINETNIEVTRSLIRARIHGHMDSLEDCKKTLSKIEQPSANEYPQDSITSKAMIYSLNALLDAYRHEIVIVQDALQL